MTNPELEEPQKITDDPRLAEMIRGALSGDENSENQLFLELRTYVMFVANEQMDSSLQGKFGPSDIAQQSMLKAAEQLLCFRGSTVAEFKGWLRQIVVNEAKLARRTFRADKRDVCREVALDATERDTPEIRALESMDNLATPCTHALMDERADLVRKIIGRLPQDYQTAVRLRNWESLSFEEIGERMNISTSGAAKIWYRALIEVQRLYQLQNEFRTQ